MAGGRVGKRVSRKTGKDVDGRKEGKPVEILEWIYIEIGMFSLSRVAGFLPSTVATGNNPWIAHSGFDNGGNDDEEHGGFYTEYCMYVLPASFSQTQYHPTKNTPQQMSSFLLPSSKVHLWCMISLIWHLIYLHFICFPPTPTLETPQATCGWRHHLPPRLAMASGTSSHRRWNHNLRLAWKQWLSSHVAKMMAQNGYRKTSDTVIWGLFGEYFGIVGMILGIIWQMLWFYELILQ